MSTEALASWEELPLTALPGIGPKRAAQFAELLGARTLNDLLRVLPRKYQEPARWVVSADWADADGERV